MSSQILNHPLLLIPRPAQQPSQNTFQTTQSHSQHISPYTPSQVTPTYSPFNNERSTNNSPENVQISEELDNFITLQPQLPAPRTLTINQLSSAITSSSPPTPTPISDYTPSLAHSSTSTESPPVLIVLIEPLNENSQITHSHPNPKPPENISTIQTTPILPIFFKKPYLYFPNIH